MRLRHALPILLLLLLVSLPASAQWRWGRPTPPRVGACFYREPGFRGPYFCLSVHDRWPSLPPGFNDRISSIRVFRGARLRLFNSESYSGISILIDNDVWDLRQLRFPDDPRRSWNDRISAIAVFRERDEWEHGHRDRWDHERRREEREERREERYDRGY